MEKFNISLEKDRLKKLEQSEKYVFHGSSASLQELEPRAPFTTDKKQTPKSLMGNPVLQQLHFQRLLFLEQLLIKTIFWK